MPSVAVEHPVDQVSAAAQSVGLDVDVDEHTGLGTRAEAACNRREVAVADPEGGSAASKNAQAFADDPGKRRPARLDLWACVYTACKWRADMKALPLIL